MTGSADDPFARISAAAALANGVRASAKAAGACVSPVPGDAPPRLTTHKTHGTPSAWWTYAGPGGEALHHVARFDKPDGSKVVLPLTLWSQGASLRWEWKAFPEPRPLYRLADLAARPGVPALVVEGEKTADIAAVRFAEFAVISWSGGSNATGKADWSPVNGRDLVVFPDADAPGRKAAADVARRAIAAGAATVAVVELPAFLPEGWDLADDWLPAFSQADVKGLIEDARASSRPGGVEWPWGYRMERDGLFFDQPTNAGGTVPLRLSSAFEVLGLARDGDGRDWSPVLRFADPDGRTKTLPVSRARLAGGGAEVRGELSSEGLTISTRRGSADRFVGALAEVRCARRLVLTSTTGWCGSRFVLPGQVIPAAGEPVLFTGEASALHYRQMGTLAGWRANVAALAEGNHLLAFALSLGFLGPLLRLLDLEGGGVHFRGPSSCGKTTLAQAAGSVWGGGGPLGFGQTWRTTANALENVAYGHNDSLAVFDELALVAPEEAGAAAYSLASGQAKARSKADGSLRRRSEWRVAILSTGEIGLADHIRASRKGDRPMAGQELRLLDIAADAGARMGVWETLHGQAGPAELSDRLRVACGRDYGHAGPAFVARLAADPLAAIGDAKAIMIAFLKTCAERDDSGQAQRAAARFAAIAAAGELATAFGVVGWEPGAASAAALKLYRRWASAFGRDKPREERDILERVRAAIESQRSMFAPIGDEETSDDALPSPRGRDGEARALTTLGFRYVRGPSVLYYFHDDGWAKVFRGFNSKDAARVLLEAGFLVTDSGENRLKRKLKHNGEALRLYCVKPSILDLDLDG